MRGGRRRAATLLLHRRTDNGRWALPGGAIEIGETADQAIVREVPPNFHPGHLPRLRDALANQAAAFHR